MLKSLYIGVTGFNTDVNDCRCAGDFVRVRRRCSGAVESQFLQKCENGEVNTSGNEVWLLV